MKKLEIVEADLSNPDHASAILYITDNYAKDPMGIEKTLPKTIKTNLIDELKKFPGTLCLLAFLDGKPAGAATCFYGFSTFKAARLINIHDLAVNPEYRRQGIGEALMVAVEKKAREEKCCKVTLEVREDNPARSLYERNGFEYGNPKMLFMQKNLA